ncbi:hypothetical protein KUTeg_012326 [Tegillarca granosa]|uniref:Uncharacterized protein n=1 Tax=Tegillarca granosa TaxID=220873 RepID=A0ABQ9EZ81_TEGGR|nr:hypothetical protein KUTeg_012326 [Tegillarca granosa]
MPRKNIQHADFLKSKSGPFWPLLHSHDLGLINCIEKEIFTSGIPKDSTKFHFKDKMAKFLVSSRSDNTVL